MYNINKMLEYFSAVFVTQSYPVVVEVFFQISHRNEIILLDHFLNGKIMVPRKNIRGDGLSNCGECKRRPDKFKRVVGKILIHEVSAALHFRLNAVERFFQAFQRRNEYGPRGPLAFGCLVRLYFTENMASCNFKFPLLRCC